MKTRKPIIIPIKSEVFKLPNVSSGELIYYYSERLLIKAADKKFKRAATRKGFSHLKDQDQPNGLMVFHRKPKAIIRIIINGKTYEGDISHLIKEYNDDAETLSPHAFRNYASAMNKKARLSPRIIDEEIYIM